MSVSHAEIFLKSLRETEFRKSLYALNSIIEFEEFLKIQNIPFGSEEMSESLSNLHGRCQTEEEAGYLKECYYFYKMLILDWQSKK